MLQKILQQQKLHKTVLILEIFLNYSQGKRKNVSYRNEFSK